MLSDDTTTKFRAALREHCADPVASRDEVNQAVEDAAKEAQKSGMSAEHFVIWVKQGWDEIMDEGRLSDSANPTRTRDAVVSSAIKAYYVQ
ncbi:MAG: hypothetical protein ABI229_09510 [Gemmatimonadaceae bacterium]